MTRKRTILIVDDTEGILDAMYEILTLHKYAVLVAEDEEGMKKHLENKEHMPDIILMDVLLSGQDGRVITKELKSNPDTKDIPIVLMSAHPDASRTISECGADGFIAKPFDIKFLLATIKSIYK